MNIAVITGASSGIGEEFLRQVVRQRGVFGSVPFEEIWIIARRLDRLESLKIELDGTRIRVFGEDITNPQSISDLTQALAKSQPTIGLLVNCAGMGHFGNFEDTTLSATHSMITLNCTALTQMTSICLPYMIPNGDLCSWETGPRIINIASSAGFLPQPGFATYAATKSFVISFSRALHAELKVHHIGVTAVCPGPVETEFFAVASDSAVTKPTGFKAHFTADVRTLVRKSLAASLKGKSMYVPGVSQKIFHVLAKILPHRWLIYFAAKTSQEVKPPQEEAPATPVQLEATKTAEAENTASANPATVAGKESTPHFSFGHLFHSKTEQPPADQVSMESKVQVQEAVAPPLITENQASPGVVDTSDSATQILAKYSSKN